MGGMLSSSLKVELLRSPPLPPALPSGVGGFFSDAAVRCSAVHAGIRFLRSYAVVYACRRMKSLIGPANQTNSSSVLERRAKGREQRTNLAEAQVLLGDFGAGETAAEDCWRSAGSVWGGKDWGRSRGGGGGGGRRTPSGRRREDERRADAEHDTRRRSCDQGRAHAAESALLM